MSVCESASGSLLAFVRSMFSPITKSWRLSYVNDAENSLLKTHLNLSSPFLFHSIKNLTFEPAGIAASTKAYGSAGASLVFINAGYASPQELVAINLSALTSVANKSSPANGTSRLYVLKGMSFHRSKGKVLM